MRNPRLIDGDRAAALRASGWKLEEIARELDCALITVWRALKRLNAKPSWPNNGDGL